MNQRKIGAFLKHLRKNKGLTQEELAERLYVSSRTVSRWETGNNMPDLDMLIELADFYDVDIRELIDGERKSEKMENEAKDTLKKAAAYAVEENVLRKLKLLLVSVVVTVIMLVLVMLFGEESKGLLNGIVSETICRRIMWIPRVLACGLTVLHILLGFDLFDKINCWKRKRWEKNRDESPLLDLPRESRKD